MWANATFLQTRTPNKLPMYRRVLLSWVILSVGTFGFVSCKKKDKDNPSGGGGSGGGLPTDNRVSFKVNGRLLEYTPLVSFSGGFERRSLSSVDTLITGVDTIEFGILFPLPMTRTDTSYQIHSQNDVPGGEFRVTYYRTRAFYVTSARHGNRYSYLNVQLSTSGGNVAQGTFSGLLYNYWEASDSIRITDGEFRLRF
ncbi:MAG: hypothetical protein RMK19_06835 [Bacteroidia bacterium]|nr:hypothetical protein [Bacteroidia bacterium]